ncbi:MAG: peptidase [Acidiferrobacteraceae bacterium]|jgi:penicillin-binding protein 1A|nr:peptidase [Acidiferrobacteraceae bacterium]MDP6434247.1 penicillin-binding protein 1A [Arenicellales bacterium]MDP6671824.1 penicillin-binding protein 1A [Arenicellales bacterium]MDP6723959.1 penicillin-binding protein 1A [Arenicellales bacterium]|tara:strand:- start:28930 stop:31305 length:2376 start_codon:yes stop_codon:yes gene_type:complete
MRRSSSTLVRILAFFAATGILGAITLGIGLMVLIPDLPSIESIQDIHLKVPLRVYTADGKMIAEFGDERRIPVSIDEVPETLVKAILAVEDDAFYSHPGVDFVGVLRAMITNIRSGERGQGASTITMQVAQNYFLGREKTWPRKIKQALLAFRIESALDKNQILELYLNKIFLGHRSYGFASAARIYYNQPLQNLSLPQIAMLAGLPQAPSRNNPLSNPKGATQRRNHVLTRMLKLGSIDKETYDAATQAAITARLHVAKVELKAPYVAEMARKLMVDRYGRSAYENGYSVYTTIVSGNQMAADKALQKGLLAYTYRHGFRGPIDHLGQHFLHDQEKIKSLIKRHPRSHGHTPGVVTQLDDSTLTVELGQAEPVTIGWKELSWARKFITARRKGAKPKRAFDIVKRGDVVYVRQNESGQWALSQLPKVSGALVSVNPGNGAILALVGGWDYHLGKYNRATQAKRQPGSNIKPFIYSASLEKGFTAASQVTGAPIVVNDPSTETIWRPENYSGKFFGPTRLRQALSLSLNLVSVRLLRAIGIPHALDHLERFGFDRSTLPTGLALALGTASTTPLEIASGYGVFANGGYRVNPFFVSRVEDQRGRIVSQPRPSELCSYCLPAQGEMESWHPAQQVISPANAFITTSMLRQVIRTGTAKRANTLGRKDLAGKTGTTNNFRDAWFSGFNSSVVTTVWIGFDQPKDLGKGEAGSRAALPVWIDYMKEALKGVPETELEQPDSVVSVRIGRDSASPVDEDDPDGFTEYFMAGTEPTPSNPRGPKSGGPAIVTEGLF